ncbi:unnamed protein product [Urochloa decumbens]|uniref:DUF1618 domain-containing protein n=1 Tax=Urochloa decumbens TaxID=240449 RepID=A0ABC9B5F3_9POAL
MIVVAELRMVALSNGNDEPTANNGAELCMFRSREWSIRHLRICLFRDSGGDREVAELTSRWRTDAVVPASDRTLCWVGYSCGVLFCDMREDSPWLRYLPLPDAPFFGRASNRNLRVTASGELKFVNILPRCCCGGAGASKCESSHNAYTIQTWTLRIADMEWVMDGMVDATELWVLESYNGLPRVPLDYPIVSMDEPHIICFMLCEDHHVKHGGGRTLWLLMVDTRSKTIQSVSRYPGDWLPRRALVSSSVSYYMNSHPTCSRDHGASTAQGQTSQMDTEGLNRDDSSRNLISYGSSTEHSVQASEILALFQEIPSYGLCRDDMLKAYSILSHCNGHQFRSFLGLPLSLRKDWLLMAIKDADT